MRRPDAPVRVFRFNSAWLTLLGLAGLLLILAGAGAWHGYSHIGEEAARAGRLEAEREEQESRLRQIESQLMAAEKALDSFAGLEGEPGTYLQGDRPPVPPSSQAATFERDEAVAGLLSGPDGESASAWAGSDSGDNLEHRVLAVAAGADGQHSGQDEIHDTVGFEEDESVSQPHLWPVPDGRVTSDYGWRINPVTRVREYHRGIDVGAPTGTPIVATGDGRVSFAGRLRLYGETVKIRHGDGIDTLYAHCHELAVSVGERVSAGQIIGYVGMTGRSTGPHVHYEVHEDGEPTDPRQYLPD